MGKPDQESAAAEEARRATGDAAGRGRGGRLSARRKRATVVNMVVENPEAGVPLGGGVRKVRVARLGRGKSVGARVVFLFAGEDIPVFLLTVFAKNEKANLSNRDLTALIATAKELAADYRRDPLPRHSIRSWPGSAMRAPT